MKFFIDSTKRQSFGYKIYLLFSVIVFFAHTFVVAQKLETDWMKKGKYGVFVHYQYRILLGYSVARKPSFPEPSQMTAVEWNHFVNDFDVPGFVRQMKDAQVGWVIFCLDDHVFAWPCSPNTAFDQYTGFKPGEKCSRRDLILELANALHRQGIRLICYYAGLNGYMKDPQISQGLDDGAYRGDWNEKGPVPIESRKKRLQILKEYADRYGEKIAGWWFDGIEKNTYEGGVYDWNKISEIVRRANPKAVIAFSNNPDVFTCFNKGVDDYTGGDSWTKQDLIRLTPELRPAKDGILWHGKIYCGNIYHGLGDLNQFSTKELSDWIQLCNSQGGVCTIDWPFDPNTGLIKDFGFKQMIGISRVLKPANNK